MYVWTSCNENAEHQNRETWQHGVEGVDPKNIYIEKSDNLKKKDRLTIDYSEATMETRRKQNNVFEVLR